LKYNIRGWNLTVIGEVVGVETIGDVLRVVEVVDVKDVDREEVVNDEREDAEEVVVVAMIR
jgi:hypothetical protein